MSSYLGWAATAVFTASYFFKRERSLRAAQMLGAAIWVMYGIAIDAAPVVVANVLVLAAVTYTTRRHRRMSR